MQLAPIASAVVVGLTCMLLKFQLLWGLKRKQGILCSSADFAGLGLNQAASILQHVADMSGACCLLLQVKALLAGAMAAAVCVISANKGIHEGLSALLTKQERVEGEALDRWLQHVVVSNGLQHPW